MSSRSISRERRLDDLVEVLVAGVVVGDADVGEARADRREVELLEPGVGESGGRPSLRLRDP